MSATLTPLGKELRRHRLDQELRLADMARGISMSSAYLSSIETGERAAPKDFVDRVAKYLNLDDAAKERLNQAADSSVKEVKFAPRTPEQAELIVALARRFADDDVDTDAFKKFLSSTEGRK